MSSFRIWKTIENFYVLDDSLNTKTRRSLGVPIKKMNFDSNLQANGVFLESYLHRVIQTPKFLEKLNQVHAFLGFSGLNRVV